MLHLYFVLYRYQLDSETDVDAIVTSIIRRCSESVWLSVHTQPNMKHEKQVKCQWDTKQCLHLEGNPYHNKYKLPEGEEKKQNKKVVADSHCWRQLLESKTIKDDAVMLRFIKAMHLLLS